MSNIPNNIRETASKMPDYCYATHNITGQTIVIKYGESGFWVAKTQRPASVLNKMLGVTAAQAEAMYVGSMYGFDVPAANPELYDEFGLPKVKELNPKLKAGA